MATGGRNADLYDCQVAACHKFFLEQPPDLPKCQPLTEHHEIPEDMRNYAKPIYLYDITGFDARKVIAVLVGIVNDREKFTKYKTFYLKLQEDLFQLRAIPTKNQPGNGVVIMRSRQDLKFKRAKKYEKINSYLEAHYQGKTELFAKEIRKLFKNTAVVESDFPQDTIEVYMILLFEIARRLVASKEPSEEKVQFDVLPIGSAIARIVKLLECGEEKNCRFSDVFLSGGKFHCFSDSPQIRKEAIANINKSAFVNAEGEKEQLIEEATKELQDTFMKS